MGKEDNREKWLVSFVNVEKKGQRNGTLSMQTISRVKKPHILATSMSTCYQMHVCSYCENGYFGLPFGNNQSKNHTINLPTSVPHSPGTLLSTTCLCMEVCILEENVLITIEWIFYAESNMPCCKHNNWYPFLFPFHLFMSNIAYIY